MGGGNDLGAALAHVCLVGVAANGARGFGKTFVHPGMHANFVIHGIFGFLHFQSGATGLDVTGIYTITKSAARYLALPCLMADLNASNQALQAIHLISGVVPFLLEVSGQPNAHLGNLCIALNIVLLCYFSFEHKREYGWFTAVAALFAYFASPQTGIPNLVFPIALAVMDYCSFVVSGDGAPELDPRKKRR